MTTETLLSQIKQHYLAIHSEALRSEDGESAQRHLSEFWQRIQPIISTLEQQLAALQKQHADTLAGFGQESEPLKN